MATIVIMEDEEDILLDVKAFLEFKGHTVFAAANGLEGVRLVQEHRPNLVILDFNMPGLKGRELLNQIRAGNADIPLIIVSGYAESDIHDDISGFENYVFIRKPMELEALEHAVKSTVIPR